MPLDGLTLNLLKNELSARIVGAKVEKGDPMGYFLFGGSDIILIFSREAGFTMTARAGTHLEMGREYGRLNQ